MSTVIKDLRLDHLSWLYVYILFHFYISKQALLMYSNFHARLHIARIVSFVKNIDDHSVTLRRLAREAKARVLHLARSAAALGDMSRLSPLILRSFSTVRRHVSLGRPIVFLS